MEKIKFNYRNHQSHPIKVSIPSDEINKFEDDCKNKIRAKYKDRLVSPLVEVIVSEDGSIILAVHLIADGVLEDIR